MKNKKKIHNKNKKTNKFLKLIKKNKIVAGLIVLILGVVAATAIVICINNIQNRNKEIDYSQKITSENGEVFNPNYELGSKNNLSIHFEDLECMDNCENIKNFKIGDQILERGKDYEVKKGSVIIIIFANILENLNTGEYDIIFDFFNGDRQITIGVKINIEDKEKNCAENQTLENNECVDAPLQEENQGETSDNTNQTTDTGQSNSTNPNTNNETSSSGQILYPERYSDAWFYACPMDPWWEGTQVQYRACARIPDAAQLKWTRSGKPGDYLKGYFAMYWGAAKEGNRSMSCYFSMSENSEDPTYLQVPDGFFRSSSPLHVVITLTISISNGRWSTTWKAERGCLIDNCEPLNLSAEEVSFIENLAQQGTEYLNEIEASYQKYSKKPYSN